VVWAIRYAGQLLNRFQRAGDDGRTAFERRKGRPYRRRLPEFGELVMFLTVADGKRRRELDERFRTGMYVGLLDRSDEVVVLTKTGYYKVNTVRRLPAEQRGDKKFAEECKGLPWKQQADASAGDAENVIPFVAAAPIVPDDQLPPSLEGRSKLGPRRTYIRREVELRPVAEGGFGLTDGCRGCAAFREGKPAVAHSEACRTRIESAMAQN